MAFIGVLMFAQTLFAAGPDNYWSLKLGCFLPNEDRDGLKDYDTSAGIGVMFGHEFTREVAFEVGAEYYSTELKSSEPYYGDDFYDADTGDPISDITVSYDHDVSVLAVPITVKFQFPLSNELTGFFGAGIGFYNATFDADETYWSPGYAPFSGGSISDSGNCVGYHVVAGMDLAVSYNMAVGMEVKWSSAEMDFEEGGYGTVDMNVGGTTVNLAAKLYF
jgi:opacity protein-like surface antigen